MPVMTEMSPEDRVQLLVGGRLTPDAVGQGAYDAVLAAVAADPAAHMAAFERLFLNQRPSRKAITELHLAGFLVLMRRHAPDQVAAAARRLDQMMGSLARRQAGEATEATAPQAAHEIARQQRQLARQRAGLAQLLRGN